MSNPKASRSAAQSRRKRLGARIRRLRREAGYESIEAFAQALGYSWITVSRYERGISEISIDRLHQIADVLKISISELIDDSEAGGRRVA